MKKLIKCYLNRTEYIEYLLKLKKYGEYDLLKEIIIINQKHFDFGDDFDLFLEDLLGNNKKLGKKDSTVLTKELYDNILNIMKESNQMKDSDEDGYDFYLYRDFNEKITPEEYIERIMIPDMNLSPKNRKNVSIYYYQNINYYEGGQIFGTVALEDKLNKISATAIAVEDSYIGTLTREEYRIYLLSLHLKKRESLYSLINSYDILGIAPKKAFENRFCHLFKCIRFKRGSQILEQKKKINSVYIFRSGEFSIYINNNILELYDLVIKIKKIQGKMLGKNESEIKRELSNIYTKKEYYSNNYNSIDKMRFYLKKYKLIISIINDKLCIGLMDTIDPETKLGLFNCTCETLNCDGYEITYDSLNLVNKEYHCLNNSNKLSLINLEYYLKRILLHIKDIETKIQKFEDNLKSNKKSKSFKNIKINPEKNVFENESDYYDEFEEIRRNTFVKQKKNANKEINLVQNVGNVLKNKYISLIKKKLNKAGKKLTLNSYINNKYKNVNVKTSRNKFEKLNSKNSTSLISKIEKSIIQKKNLLHLSQSQSNKYMKFHKDEIRNLLLEKNKAEVINSYADLESIFNRGDKNGNSGNKNKSILDNMINSLNKRRKYERKLSSYLINNIHEESDKDIKAEEKTIQTETIKTEKIKSKEFKKNNNINFLMICKRFLNKNKYKYKTSSNLIEDENDYLSKKNIVTLDGRSSLSKLHMLEESPNQVNKKKYNKQLNMNKFRKNGILDTSNDNKNKNLKKINSNKDMHCLSDSNKYRIHLIDPLLYDKFNERYFVNNKKRFKALEM